MIDVNYGHIRLKLAEQMEKQNVSISKLAYRSEMERTQLKNYIRNEVARIDLAVMSRLCYALQCDLSDLMEYIPPEKKSSK